LHVPIIEEVAKQANLFSARSRLASICKKETEAFIAI
jgi:hypothetical protein